RKQSCEQDKPEHFPQVRALAHDAEKYAEIESLIDEAVVGNLQYRRGSRMMQEPPITCHPVEAYGAIRCHEHTIGERPPGRHAEIGHHTENRRRRNGEKKIFGYETRTLRHKRVRGQYCEYDCTGKQEIAPLYGEIEPCVPRPERRGERDQAHAEPFRREIAAKDLA